MNMFTVTLLVAAFGIFTGTLSYLCFHIQCKKMERRQKFLKAQIEMENHHYEMIEKQMEQNRTYLAEIEKQLDFLDQYALSEEDSLISEYRQDLLKTKQQLCIEEYCSNPILNSVFQHKKAECREKGIALTLDLSAFQCGFAKEVDMIGILYNLFDNAIEACGFLENPGDRKLSVMCRNRESETVLEFVNSRNPEMALSANQKTWKKDAKNHGLGLEILERLVKKYQGTMELESLEKQYRVWISFPYGEMESA